MSKVKRIHTFLLVISLMVTGISISTSTSNDFVTNQYDLGVSFVENSISIEFIEEAGADGIGELVVHFQVGANQSMEIEIYLNMHEYNGHRWFYGENMRFDVTLGVNDLPMFVAPTSTLEGLVFSIKSLKTYLYGSILKFSNSFWSYT